MTNLMGFDDRVAKKAGRTNASAPTWSRVIYNHMLPVFNFSLGKDTHWRSTKIFMKSGARS
jgi:hypothetical protein